MATRYVTQATQQLAPGYQQQTAALQSQIPAIQQLYASLNQGLQSQQQAQNQGVLENASGRGLLHSTIPVTGIQQVAAQTLQQQGTNNLNQLKDIGGINSQVAGIQTDQATAIAQLANALAGTDLAQQQFAYDKQQSSKNLALQQQIANQQYQLQLKAAHLGF